jgi:hypothetical protein
MYEVFMQPNIIGLFVIASIIAIDWAYTGIFSDLWWNATAKHREKKRLELIQASHQRIQLSEARISTTSAIRVPRPKKRKSLPLYRFPHYRWMDCRYDKRGQ